jgi:hypothetical protein
MFDHKAWYDTSKDAIDFDVSAGGIIFFVWMAIVLKLA